jgi:hypothetical protein
LSREKRITDLEAEGEIQMRKTRAGIVFAALIFMSSSAWTRLASPRPSVNPATYSSTSGEFSLSVDPTDRVGRGPADYRFIKNGAVVWANRLPFTLYEAVVTDLGLVIGYAYTNGLEGFSEAGYKAGTGDFIVLILSEKGEVILKETHPRERSGFIDDVVPNPAAKGIVVDGQGKRAIFRITDPDIRRRSERWWIYDPDTGKRRETVEPEKPIGSYGLIFSIKAVPGTPLVLTQWSNYATSQMGAIFALVDPQGKIIWDKKVDYSYSPQEKNRDEIERIIREYGAIIDVRKAGVFDLLFVTDRLRVSFAVVEQAPGKWEVKETGQSPFTPLALSPPALLPALNLKELGATNLSTGIDQKTRPIHDIAAFEFDPKGRICALRTGRAAIPALLFLSQEGEILKELQLPIPNRPENVKYSNPASVGDSRFVVRVSSQAIGSAAQWFLADFDAGTVNKIDSDECPVVNKAAGFPDGRFAALTTRYEKYTMTRGLFLFDPNGKVIWKKEQGGYSKKPDDLLSPVDIVPYREEGIAVLDDIRRTIQIFDTKGIRIIELEKAGGRKSSYLTSLAQDRDAGFLVYDSTSKTFIQVDGNGTILVEFAPKLADGSPIRIIGGIKRSPQGDLWTSDGGALFRLGANHTVDITLGLEPKSSNLSKPGRVEVGLDDRVYIEDRRTGTIHVFDPSDSLVGQCSPKAEDLTSISGVQHIAVSRAGDIYISLNLSGAKYLHFRKDMTREGWATLIDTDKIRQKWYFQPASDLTWVMGNNDIFLVQGLSKIIKKISRRADGLWLEYPEQAAVAADGSLAVLARTQSEASGTYSINIYSSSGDARKTFALPFSLYTIERLAYNGQHVFIRVDNDLFVYGLDGQALGQFTLPPEAKTTEWNGPWLAMQGKEFWFVETQGRKLHRFAVPKSFRGSIGATPGGKSALEKLNKR